MLESSNNNFVNGNNITGNIWFGIGMLYSCNNNFVSGNNIGNNYQGIGMGDSSNNSVSGNNIGNNYFGIHICCSNSSNKNFVTGNNISNNYYGIYMDDSSNSSVSGNTIDNNYLGILMWDSSYNSVTGNNITGSNWSGISLDSSLDNSIIGNNIGNNEYGIESLLYSSDNSIYQNNFINNTYDPKDAGNNKWDNGKQGNYWDDYQEKYPDAHRKLRGVWDTPYKIDGGENQDRYPLIKPYVKSKVKIRTSNLVSNDILEIISERFPFLEQLLQFLWINVDWHPAREPYNIGG